MKNRIFSVVVALTIAVSMVSFAYAYTTTYNYNTICSTSGTLLGTSTNYNDDGGSTCIAYCAGLNATCCGVRDRYDVEGFLISTTCTARSTTSVTTQSSTATNSYYSFIISYAAAQPDLTAGAVSPTTATVGTAVTLSSTLSNLGSGSSGASFTNLFQRATDSSGANATDIGTYSATTLGAGSITTATLSYTFPSAATWYVRACADKSSAANTGTITESNEGNNCGAWTAVTASAAPTAPTATISANVTSVTSGQAVTLTWSSTNSTSCTGTNFTTGNQISGTATVNPTTSTTYTVTCTGTGGTAANAVGVTVTGPTTNTTSYYGKLCTGGTSVGTYAAMDDACVSYCTGLSASCCSTVHSYDDWGSDSYTCTAYTGTQSTVTSNNTSNCNWNAGEPICSYTNKTATLINYGPAVSASIVANPVSVSSGQPALLTWASTNATSCTGTNFTTGGATSGTANLAPTTTKTYSLSCTGSGGTVSTSTVITVNVFTVTCSPSPSPVTVNQPVSWTSAVTGGTGSYTYAWGGDDGITGAASSVSKTYSGLGEKTATLTVTSGGSTIAAACTGQPCQQASCTCSGTGCGVVVQEGVSTDISASVPTIAAGSTPIPGGTMYFDAGVTNIGNNSIYKVFTNRFQIDVNANGTYDVDLTTTGTAGTELNLEYGKTCSTGTIVNTGSAQIYGSGSITDTITSLCTDLSTSGQCCAASVSAGSYDTGGGGGGGCFSPETLVAMADGTHKPIRDVVVGDKVLGQDRDGHSVVNTVTELFVHNGTYKTLVLNGSLVVTPNHPMAVLRNGFYHVWVQAGELRVGDTLLTPSGTVQVESIEPGGTLPTVHNLEVVPNHTYFAGGVLVHNKYFYDNVNLVARSNLFANPFKALAVNDYYDIGVTVYSSPTTSTCTSGTCYAGTWTNTLGTLFDIPFGSWLGATSPAWSNIPGGTHKVRMCADSPTSKLSEVNENNNCGPDYTFTVSGFDLVGGASGLNSGQLVAGQALTFFGNISNTPSSYVSSSQCQATVVVATGGACSIAVNQDMLQWSTQGATIVSSITPLTTSPTIPTSGSGGTIVTSPGEGGFFTSTAIKQDMLANGNVSFPETSFTYRTAASDRTTVDRICKVITGNNQATAKAWGSRGWGSCGNNGNLTFNGTIWQSLSGCTGAHLFGQLDCQYPGSPYSLSGVHTFATPLGVGTHTYQLTSNAAAPNNTCQASITIPAQTSSLCQLHLTPSIVASGQPSALTWILDNVGTLTCDHNIGSPTTNGGSSCLPAGTELFSMGLCTSGGITTQAWGQCCSGIAKTYCPAPNEPYEITCAGGAAPTQQEQVTVYPTQTTTYSCTATTDLAPYNFAGSAPTQFQIDTGNNGTWDTTLVGPTLSALNVSLSTQVVSPTWTAVQGTHAVRVCANTPMTTLEGVTSNNCGPSYVFTVSSATQCQDGIDNNGNGLVDTADPACTNGGDSTEESHTASTLSISTSKSTIKTGGTVVLTWNASEVVADSCTITSSAGGSLGTLTGSSGTINSGTISGETTFTLSCISMQTGQTVSSSVKVKLAPKFEEI